MRVQLYIYESLYYRNGSAVELVGLCASTVKWLHSLHKKGMYPYAGVRGKRPGVRVCSDHTAALLRYTSLFDSLKDWPHEPIYDRKLSSPTFNLTFNFRVGA